MTDSDTSLPVEILEAICEDLVWEYTRNRTYEFLPRWYLLPLLSVCKLWHLVSERYLYRSIGLGGRFPGRPRRPDNIKIGAELILALEGNPRLAMLVKELRIYWDIGSARVTDLPSPDMHLVEICPNLRHLYLRGSSGIHPSEAESLWKALAGKSLESLHIDWIAAVGRHCCPPVPVYDLMQRWPNIRKISIEGEVTLRFMGEADFEPSESLICCTKLREIYLFFLGGLRKNDFRSLQMMCSAVTELDVKVAQKDEEAVVALCKCLHAWSPTLKCLKLHSEYWSLSKYALVSEALSSLTKLQSMDLGDLRFDLDAVSSLPYLKHITFAFCKGVHHVHLLERLDKFPALTSIVNYGEESGELRDVCRRRNIELKTL